MRISPSINDHNIYQIYFTTITRKFNKTIFSCPFPVLQFRIRGWTKKKGEERREWLIFPRGTIDQILTWTFFCFLLFYFILSWGMRKYKSKEHSPHMHAFQQIKSLFLNLAFAKHRYYRLLKKKNGVEVNLHIIFVVDSQDGCIQARTFLLLSCFSFVLEEKICPSLSLSYHSLLLITKNRFWWKRIKKRDIFVTECDLSWHFDHLVH